VDVRGLLPECLDHEPVDQADDGCLGLHGRDVLDALQVFEDLVFFFLDVPHDVLGALVLHLDQAVDGGQDLLLRGEDSPYVLEVQRPGDVVERLLLNGIVDRHDHDIALLFDRDHGVFPEITDRQLVQDGRVDLKVADRLQDREIPLPAEGYRHIVIANHAGRHQRLPQGNTPLHADLPGPFQGGGVHGLHFEQDLCEVCPSHSGCAFPGVVMFRSILSASPDFSLKSAWVFSSVSMIMGVRKM